VTCFISPLGSRNAIIMSLFSSQGLSTSSPEKGPSCSLCSSRIRSNLVFQGPVFSRGRGSSGSKLFAFHRSIFSRATLRALSRRSVSLRYRQHLEQPILKPFTQMSFKLRFSGSYLSQQRRCGGEICCIRGNKTSLQNRVFSTPTIRMLFSYVRGFRFGTIGQPSISR
jgi:hypothetical protein